MFIVIELQANNEGQVANIVTAYDTLPQAEQKYHTILAAAAVSSVPKHSAVILDPMGVQIMRDGFEHEVVVEPPVEEVTENE